MRRSCVHLWLLVIGSLLAHAPIAFANAATAAELGRPVLQFFPPRDYQGDPLCQAVVQGADGVLLVANNTAALAFDGSSWQPVPFPAESTGVMQLALAADGRIYAAGGNVFGYIDGPVGRKTFHSLRSQLPEAQRNRSREFRLAAGRDGLVFTDGSDLGLWRDGKIIAVRGTPPARPQLFATAGDVYVKGGDNALYQIERDELVLVLRDAQLRDTDLIWIERLSDDRLRLLTVDRGFLLVDAARGGVSPRPIAADHLLAGKRLIAAQRLADGGAALAFTPSHGGGGLLLNAEGAVLARLDDSVGLASQNIRSLATDREGGLWIGLESGIARLQWPSAITLFDASRGLTGFVTCVARHEGVLYAATLTGLHRLRPGGADGKPATFERIFAGAVYDLLSNEDGLLFRGPREMGRVSAHGVESLLPLSAGISNFSRSRHDPRRLWTNTSQGLRSLYRADDGWRDEGLVPGFSEHVASVFEATDGTLWLASFDHGFFHLQLRDRDRPQAAEPEIRAYHRGHGLPEFAHSAVASWQGEPLFYLDGSARPFRFDAARDEFQLLPGTEKLPTNLGLNCWASMPAGRDLWFTNNAPQLTRLTLLRLADGAGDPQFLPHFVADTAGKIWRFVEESHDGRSIVWICSVNGLLRVELDRAFAAPAPLHTLLRADGVSAGAHLPAESTTARFFFSAPRFQPDAAVEYQSRLRGAETEWSAWSKEPARTYARLPRGKFVFEVRARDADGNVSEPASLAFSLFPPWWKSPWAMTLGALAALALVAAVTRALAVRALRRRLELLKAQAAVEQERLRLARDLHDDIGSGLGRVILFAGEAERAGGDPAKLSAALDRMRGTANELVQHAREIVWAVSPQHDSVASLAERVGDYAMETLAAAGIACETDIPVDLPAWPLRSDARHNLFLAAKEALHNCVKYADAKKVTITARVVENVFTLTIADDGRGFAAGERRGSGHGLRNLAQRAESLGGSAEIVSAPGAGTRVTLRIPVTPTAD